MKTKIDQFDQVNQKWEEAHGLLESKRGMLEGTQKLANIKKMINEVSTSIIICRWKPATLS